MEEHRGFAFTHEAVRDWEGMFTEQLRAKRTGNVGRSWHVNETCIKMHGGWHYFYQAIDLSCDPKTVKFRCGDPTVLLGLRTKRP